MRGKLCIDFKDIHTEITFPLDPTSQELLEVLWYSNVSSYAHGPKGLGNNRKGNLNTR